jgi:hypothetical protein
MRRGCFAALLLFLSYLDFIPSVLLERVHH